MIAPLALALALALVGGRSSQCTASSPPPPSGASADCTFDSSQCGWAGSGKKQWTRGTSTPTRQTGAPKAPRQRRQRQQPAPGPL